MDIQKMKIPEGQKLEGNKPLLIELLNHLGREGSKKPKAARNTADTLLLEYIGDREIIRIFNEQISTDW